MQGKLTRMALAAGSIAHKLATIGTTADGRIGAIGSPEMSRAEDAHQVKPASACGNAMSHSRVRFSQCSLIPDGSGGNSGCWSAKG